MSVRHGRGSCGKKIGGDALQLQIGIDPASLSTTLANQIAAGVHNVVKAFEVLLATELAKGIRSQLPCDVKRDPTVTIHAGYFKSQFASVHDLASSGYETWYSRLELITPRDGALDISDVIPVGIKLAPIEYGGGVKRRYQVKMKPQKTQTRYGIELLHIVIPAELFRNCKAALRARGVKHGRLMANLRDGGGAFNTLASFIDTVTGEKWFCSCAKEVHRMMARNPWPREIEPLLADARYKDGICHLCTAKSKGTDGMLQTYGDTILFDQGAYMTQVAMTQDLTPETVRAEVHSILGISRWVAEAELYSIVKDIFAGAAVQREASPRWLGRQRLDIFVPSKSLAIEFHGEQHFQPVSVFGGEDGLRVARQRDRKKADLCKDNGVHLVCFRHDQPISLAYVRQRLHKFLK